MMSYVTNGEYLADEFKWLKLRAKRIMAERVGQTGRYHDGGEDGDVAELRREEDRLRSEIDARLAVHREQSTFCLGLDKLCLEHDLDVNERLVVLLLSPAAIAETLGDEVLGAVGSGGSAWCSAADALMLLGPPTIDDWIRLRSLFLPTGKLRSSGIVEVREGASSLGSAGDLSGYLFLSRESFDVAAGLDADEPEPG